jgi:hypothetical protein
MHHEGALSGIHTILYYYLRGMQDACKVVRALLVTQLTQRFGPLPSAIMGRIEDATPHTLMYWGERVLSATSLERVFGRVS